MRKQKTRFNYARFSHKNITQDYANPLLPNDVDSVHNRSLLVSYTSTITPKLGNEFRFGFTNVMKPALAHAEHQHIF